MGSAALAISQYPSAQAHSAIAGPLQRALLFLQGQSVACLDGQMIVSVAFLAFLAFLVFLGLILAAIAAIAATATYA